MIDIKLAALYIRHKMTSTVIINTVVAILLILVLLGDIYDTFIAQSSADSYNISRLHFENDALKTEIEKYHVTEQDLIDMGASSEQAQWAIQASEVYNISPKH